jgi:hypothetical protein
MRQIQLLKECHHALIFLLHEGSAPFLLIDVDLVLLGC